MKNPIQLSKLLNIFTVLVLICLIIFQIENLSSLSSEVDDIGVYRTLVEAQQRKLDFYHIVNTSSKSELIHEIEAKGNLQAKTLALFLQKVNLLEPTLKLIASYKSLYSVPIGWTYAPGQYFITQLLVNGDESYQSAKFKIRVVSKIFWLLGIIGIIFILSKIKEKNIIQAGLLFLVLIISSQSQTSYSAHGSSYAAGLIASSITFLIAINLIQSQKITLTDTLLLFIVTLIQYQLIPVVFLIFSFIWLQLLFSINLTIKERSKNFIRLIRFSLIFAALFFIFVFPTFKDKMGSGLNWNAGSNHEYSLNDNYLDLNREITFQKSILLITEPFNAFIDTCASIFSPISFSFSVAKSLGLMIFVLIIAAFVNFLKNKDVKPYVLTSLTILFSHFLLYIFGFVPFSPTRHSLYLTVPLVVLGVIGTSNLISIFEIWHPKLTNLLISIGVLLLAFACYYLNVSYITKRADPFDQAKVIELLASTATPTIVLNSDWTYQHYGMPQVQKVKILLDLNLHGKKENFSVNLEKVRPIIGAMNAGDTIYLMRVSHWGSLDNDDSGEKIADIICKYFNYSCLFSGKNQLFSSTTKVSSEWVENIQGFTNSIYIETMNISVINSSSKN